ncbi:MAG: tetratricopeptide repeat protein, partial [Nostoc sp.]
LWKLESENSLTDSEVKLLQDNNLTQIVTIAQDIKRFAQLKEKYQATKYQDSHPDSRLYRILKKLDTEASLNDNEYEWLLNNELFEAIEISEKQDSATRAKVTQLKSKYQASQHPDTSLSSQLYKILQKLDADEKLIDSEIDWLEKQGLTETIAIAEELEQKREFIALKVKYKASQYEDLSPANYLYAILKKLDSETYLNEQDINFLRQSQLSETIEIANDKYASVLKSKIVSLIVLSDSEICWLKNSQYEDIIILAQNKEFADIKRKYGLIDPSLPLEPFYAIMVKLEKKERLDPKFVLQLMEKGLLDNGKIALAYYKLEAEFYEQELGRTGHKWHIPTASGYWRKANEPKRALKLTDLDLNRVNDSNLKSAILVTRGAAFRDVDKLDDAEGCAKKAMEYQPDSHQPYTLMGAICYDRHDYEEGNYWFEQAIQRGAETKDIDAEIKRVIRSAKNEEKRHEAAEYLLKEDAVRYAWAKSYLKKSSDNGK